VLGSNNVESSFKLQLEMSWWGGGVNRITLADYDKAVHSDEPYVLTRELKTANNVLKPFAAQTITINGTAVSLRANRWSFRSVESGGSADIGEYYLTIANGDDQPILDIVRRYVVRPGSYDVALQQRLVNRTSRSLSVAFKQNIQGDLRVDETAFLGDRRMFFTGFKNLASRQGQAHIFSNEFYLHRSTVLETPRVWPNPNIEAGTDPRLIWVASTNRYFAIATHLRITGQMNSVAAIPPLTERFPNIEAQVESAGAESAGDQTIMLTASTGEMQLGGGRQQALDLGFYAGPRAEDPLTQTPTSLLNLDGLRLYSMGGMIGFCTFSWLSSLLLGFLKLIEGQVLALGGVALGVYDWGVAIIILVAVVRLLLHPLTKKAQVNMMKMSKQMQAMQPEIEKLKSKYKDDQQKMNQEMMKLYREKGVNPAGMLGCLPMFLQMPIWVALYAVLYFAIELRHEPAFYGVFQQAGELAGVYWPFLADLGHADQFIPLPGDGVTLTWLPFIQPHFGAINLLPILMGLVFVAQQHYMSPPATTEQQAQQQRLMKWIMPLFLPLVLYSAPSGLTLYILVSTGAGVFDSYMVRKHVNEQEEAGTLFEKKQPKAGGFRDRINKAVEQKRQELEKAQKGAQGKGGVSGGRGGGSNGNSPGTKRVKSKSRKK